KFTQYECEIVTSDSALLQLSDQIELCLDRFGDDQQAGSVLVQPVNDTGTWHLTELRSMIEQRIQQGPVPVAVPGMDDQAGRFIDDNQMVIFKQNSEWNGFRLM